VVSISPDGAGDQFPAFSASATLVLTSTKLSGVTEMVSMPALTSSLAKAGSLDGAWPQSPTLAPASWALAMACLDHPDHRRIGFAEQRGQFARVAVDAERQLGQVVRADGEAVEAFGELLGADDVGGDLAMT
jgi:hypothetical protein